MLQSACTFPTLTADRISNPSLTREALSGLLKQPEFLKEIFGGAFFDLEDPASPPSILQMCFENMCGSFTTRLSEALARRNIKAIASTSGDRTSRYHIYATLLVEGKLLILDPTIGQYVYGCRDIFMGSREALRMQIYSEETRLHCFNENRQELFLKLWGDESVTAFTNPRTRIAES